MKQTELAKKCNISDAFLSEIIARKKRPSWNVAKKLSKHTSSTIDLWMEGTTAQIRKALKRNGNGSR